MEIRVLGPIEVWSQRGPEPIGHRRQRCLLAVLAIDANIVVPTTEIIERIWSGVPPVSVQKSLRTYVSRLRRALRSIGGSKVIRQGDGYRLQVEPNTVDLWRFRRLAEAGRAAAEANTPADASELLHEALELWHGDPVADLDGHWAAGLGARLVEERLAVVEDRIEVDLQLGRDGQLVGELTELASQHPGRERVIGQLMRALSRSGRQQDALTVYREAKQRMAESGLEPCQALRDLELRILRADVELLPAPLATGLAPAARSASALSAVVDPRHTGSWSITAPLGRLDRPVRGRKHLLEKLAIALAQATGRVHLLCGLGGCGKTTVALDVARSARDRGVEVWWLSAVSAESLDAGMRELAAQLGASTDQIQRAWSGLTSAADLIWRLLNAFPRPWLLIFDNADDVEVLTPINGRIADGTGWLRPPGSDLGRVLLTSRDGDPSHWGSWCRKHEVTVLPPLPAVDVLLDLATGEAGDPVDAMALARRLGGLPLALRLAGTYLASCRSRPAWLGQRPITTFAAYQAALDDHFAETIDSVPPDEQPVRIERELVTGTWEVSLQLLERRNVPEALPLLRVLSCLAPSPMPYTLVLAPETLAATELFAGLTADRLCLALTALSSLGLVDLHPAPSTDGCRALDTVSLHPLVRDTTRHHPAFEVLRRSHLVLVAALIREATGRLDPESPAGWPAWAVLAPHGSSGAPVLRETAILPPEALVDVLLAAVATCRYLFFRGERNRAESLLADCRPAAERLGQTHPVSLAVRHYTAWAASEAGRTAEAEAQFLSVLADRWTVLGADHPDTLETRHRLADVFQRNGRLDAAEHQFRDTYSACRRVLGEQRAETLAARHGLAWVIQQRGRLREAESEFRGVLRATWHVRGEHHPHTLLVRYGMSWVLLQLGRLAEAEAEFRAVFDTRRRVLGEFHPHTLEARQALAVTLYQRGHMTQAEVTCQGLLAIRQRVLGSDHPDTLETRQLLADVLCGLGRLTEAEVELRDVLQLRRASIGENHLDALVTRHRLADMLVHRRLLTEAEAEYRLILEERSRVLGDTHLHTLAVRHALVWVMQLSGRIDAAERGYRELLDAYQSVVGPTHPDTLAIRTHVAGLLIERSAIAEAVVEYQAVLADCLQVLGDEHPHTVEVRERLGQLDAQESLASVTSAGRT